MRQLHLFVAFLLISFTASAQTWNGTNNTNWDDPGNWSGGAAPTGTGNVIIPTNPTGARFPKFTTAVSIGSIDMQTGSQLDVNGKSLTLTPTNQYLFFTGSTVNNTGTGDIVLNVNTGTGGYGMYIRSGAIFNDDLVVNAVGNNDLVEGDQAGPNNFNGNVTYNINSALSLNLGSVTKSIYTSNLSVVRTVAGTTNLFNKGAAITGNLAFNSAVGGATAIGSVANITTVAGTVNLLCINTVADKGLNDFNLSGIINNTTGGIINVQRSRGFVVQNDTLLLNSLSITNYSGFAYGALFNNKLSGTITISDDASYGGGYSTNIRNNTITGTVLYGANGTNNFAEGDLANSTNTYNGNVSFNVTGSADVSFSNTDTANVTGNLSITRTSRGNTFGLGKGGIVSGNFSFSNNTSGDVTFGNASVTNIGGMINISLTDTLPALFQLIKLKNSTGGGTITAQNTLGFYLANDTLLVNSITISGYTGSQYGYLFNSKITGNVNISDAASSSTSYTTTIRNSDFTGTTVYTVNGGTLYEDADIANSTNKYTGNVTYNLNSQATATIATGDTVSVTGNLLINRSGYGTTQAFSRGGIINGNFSFTNNTAGNLYLGTLASTTLIGGTVNIIKMDTLPTSIEIYRLKNLTAGGLIQANHTKGFELRQDTLLVNNISILDYQGSAYGNMFDNKITGDVSTADNAGYAGGYSTDIRNNTINGNANFTVKGPNSFYEAAAANYTNRISGNAIYTITGSSTVSIATGDTVAVGGNLLISRTAPGNTYGFGTGGNIGGNFQFTNNTAGVTSFGNLSSSTNIAGKADINIQATGIAPTAIYRFKNNSAGGNINLENTTGFDLRQDTLVVNSLTATGYRGNGYAYLFDSKITGNLAVADDATYSGGYSTDIRNNLISGSASFSINGSNQFYDGIAANYGNTYLGNVVYNRAATGALMSVATGDTSYYGSGLSFNSDVARPINRSLIQFISNANGAYSQTGTQLSILPTVIMRKAAGARLSLNSPLTIGTKIVLDSGIITATTTNKLIIPDNITYTGGSNISFVEGPMDKIGDDAFIFPVGRDTAIATIAISAPAAITDVFTASYTHKEPNQDGYNASSKDPALDHISRTEYWILNRTTGTSNVIVTLGYDALKHSGTIVDPAELRVSRWNGSLWTNEGNGGTTGTPVTGTIRSAAAITSFSPFTLASTTARNTLPVKLISFTAIENNGIVSLQWKTENEINFDHYEVERSSNRNSFISISSQAARNLTTQNTYNEADVPSAKGVFYYRLKMIDKNGVITYSDIVAVKIRSSISVTVAPNPVKNRMMVRGLPEGSTVRILNVAGKLILTKLVTSATNQNIDLPQLPAGMYILQVLKDNSRETISFIKE